MAEFYTGTELNLQLERIFKEAEKELFLVSPYIKLHNRFKSILKSKKEEHKLQIKILFGKNENKVHESLTEDEFNFLKELPNIEIRYHPHLHAKFYANDTLTLLSSMNLYDHSQNNNIEFGILTEYDIVKGIAGDFFGKNFDEKALKYFREEYDKSDIYYLRTPQYKKNILSSKYVNSIEEIDKLSNIYKVPSAIHKRKSKDERNSGYCIRTGIKIPFNPSQPMSKKAWKEWSKYKNEDYPEKFCHKTGLQSNGKTTFRNPILN